MGSSITHSHTLEVGLDKISFMISITAISLQLVDLLKSLFSVSGKNLEAMICPFENVAFAVIEKFWQNSLNTFSICLRWPSWLVTLNRWSWPLWVWHPSWRTTSSRWLSWTKLRPWLSLPCRCCTPPRRVEETERYNHLTLCCFLHVAAPPLEGLSGHSHLMCLGVTLRTGVPYPWGHSRGHPAHEGGGRWYHGDTEWGCQRSGNGGRNGGVHRRGHGQGEWCLGCFLCRANTLEHSY